MQRMPEETITISQQVYNCGSRWKRKQDSKLDIG